jgi:hypothetical protein
MVPSLAPLNNLDASPSFSRDVFALAVLLAEMLMTRIAPSTTESWANAVTDGAARVCEHLRSARDDVPDPVVEVLTRALGGLLRERFASVSALALGLREARTSIERWASPGALDAEPPPPEEQPPRAQGQQTDCASAFVPIGWQRPERIPETPRRQPRLRASIEAKFLVEVTPCSDLVFHDQHLQGSVELGSDVSTKLEESPASEACHRPGHAPDRRRTSPPAAAHERCALHDGSVGVGAVVVGIQRKSRGVFIDSKRIMGRSHTRAHVEHGARVGKVMVSQGNRRWHRFAYGIKDMHTLGFGSGCSGVEHCDGLTIEGRHRKRSRAVEESSSGGAVRRRVASKTHRSSTRESASFALA